MSKYQNTKHGCFFTLISNIKFIEILISKELNTIVLIFTNIFF